MEREWPRCGREFRRRRPIAVTLLTVTVAVPSSGAIGSGAVCQASLATRRRRREVVPTAVSSLLTGQLGYAAQPEQPLSWSANLLVTRAVPARGHVATDDRRGDPPRGGGRAHAVAQRDRAADPPGRVRAGRRIGRRGARAAAARLATLSEREREVAVAVGRGRSDAEIAGELSMSLATVEAHVSHILVETEVVNRVQIAICVHEAGLA